MTSSMQRDVKLKAFANFLFDFFIDLKNSTSYENKNKLTKSGAQFVPQDVRTCETHSYREMFDLPTCVSCPSASDEGWMYTVLKNQTFELMLSLDSGSYSFSAAIQSCFSKSTFH